MTKTNRRGILACLLALCLICALCAIPARAAGAGTATLTVKQVFTAGGSAPGDVFDYRLTPQNAANPMPGGAVAGSYTFAVAGTGTVNITLAFTGPGAYVYELECVTSPGGGYTVDTQVYTVEIYVEDDLTPLSVIYAGDGDKAAEISFEQSYTSSQTGTQPGPAAPTTPQQGTAPAPGNAPPATNNISAPPAGGTPDPTDAVSSDTAALPQQVAAPTAAGEQVVLSGTVSWNYGDAPSADRPGQVTLYITGGGQTAATLTVSGSDGWQWSVSLPKYDAAGNLILYTVSEGNVPHYTHAVNGYDITNTYLSPNYPGDIPKTGDESNPALWIALIGGGALLLVLLAVVGKGRKRIE